jgi:hypothetical protein
LRCKPDGTMRAMYNRNQKNEYTIKDGKFTANGKSYPAAAQMQIARSRQTPLAPASPLP